MKRLTIVSMALCLALALAVPAMALDADFSGEFRVRGISNDNTGLGEGNAESASDAYYDTRTRIKANFKISDAISFTTQFDALERKWGTNNDDSNQPNYQASDDMDFEHAYATIKTPIGGLLVGRLIGSQWGPSGMGDSNNVGKDRILLFVPIENWTFVAYAEKYQERDTGTTVSADDDNKYTALVKYKGESFEAGFLLTHYDFQDFPSMRDFLNYKGRVQAYQTAAAAASTADLTYQGTYAAVYSGLVGGTLNPLIPAQAPDDATAICTSLEHGTNVDVGVANNAIAGAIYAGTGGTTLETVYQNNVAAQGNKVTTATAAAAGLTNIEAKVFVVDPYVSGNFGDFSYFGELLYGWGDGDVKGSTTRNEMTIDVLSYHVEGKYSFGPASIRGGYWFLSGDNDTTDDELSSVGYIERSQDLDLAFILTGTSEYANAGLENSLGGLGNFAGSGQSASGNVGTLITAGAKMFYVSVGFSPMENLDLDLFYANAKADMPPGTKLYNPATQANWTTNWSDDVGDEYDLKVTWTPLENLEYKFVAAYLDAGDFWKRGVANAKVDDNVTLYNALTISF